MGAQQQVYRRRIRSTQSFQKIFRAQELIATSRIAKLQAQVERSRPYTRQITAAIENIVSQTEISHPLLEERSEARVAAVLVITADRGMAGAYSANVLRTTEELLTLLRDEGKEPRLYVVGRKGAAYYRFRDRPMASSWTGISEQPRFEQVEPVARTLIDAFASHEVDEIHAVYTDFISLLSQRAEAYRLLPMVVEDVEVEQAEAQAIPQYLFEPDAQTVLGDLLPRYVVSRVYTAALEAAASESAARRRAMKSASDNADELIRALTREANQARQAEITQEIMEIVGGAEALRRTGSD
jgi:F-type H+-transporting ATPase subunit gamma